MILADKIIRLRKKNCWSQEELAEKMNVSRQAVSKWEGAQTIPDLEKILKLSALFGVTTDYLLKDDCEKEEFSGSGSDASVRTVSLEAANTYLQQRKKASVRIAFATFLCMLSPICLFLLAAASEMPALGVSEAFAVITGFVVLFIAVAIAVVLYLSCGFMNSAWKFLDEESFENAYGVSGMVKEKQKAYRNTYKRFNMAGVCLCILSPIPLLAGAFFDNTFYIVAMLSLTIVIAGIGVILLILAGVRWAGMQRLLQEGDFTASAKKKNKVRETVSTVYWLTATAIYLAWSFLSEDWEITWIVWLVAGVLFAPVMAICSLNRRES